MNKVQTALHEFLTNLDANDRERLKAVGLAAFEEDVVSLPGPDEWTKGKLRPYVGDFLENLIKSLLQ